MICVARPVPHLTPRITSSSQEPKRRVRLKSSRIQESMDRSNLKPRIFSSRQEPKRRVVKFQESMDTSILKSPPSLMEAAAAAEERSGKMWALCGFGYWVQGFRCFPWLALNFHLTQGLGLSPATLQLVQNTGNLPLVAKPLFGVLSDAVYIRGEHRLPYISIGALLQLIAWGTLVIIPVTGDTFPTQMACILIGNLGASVTEVVSDALVTKFSRTQKAGVLQSYAFIALAAGSLLGNLSGGYVLLNTQEPKIMFITFSFLLGLQLVLSLTTKETLPYSPANSDHRLVRSSLSDNLRKLLSNLVTAINEERIFYPLSWIMASIAIVPVLSGTMFCFQTQYLKLDPSIIGLSKVIGQLMVLSLTVFYTRYLKRIPLRRLVTGVQILYALAVLSDLVVVKQINLMLGISNEVYVLCLSALAEAIAQFKILPFSVLFSSLCPPGCEGSLFAFFTSGLVLSAMLSGIFGVGLSALIGVSSGDYSSLPLGILLQSLASLVPLWWISFVPAKWTADEKVVKRR